MEGEGAIAEGYRGEGYLCEGFNPPSLISFTGWTIRESPFLIRGGLMAAGGRHAHWEETPFYHDKVETSIRI